MAKAWRACGAEKPYPWCNLAFDLPDVAKLVREHLRHANHFVRQLMEMVKGQPVSWPGDAHRGGHTPGTIKYGRGHTACAVVHFAVINGIAALPDSLQLVDPHFHAGDRISGIGLEGGAMAEVRLQFRRRQMS